MFFSLVYKITIWHPDWNKYNREKLSSKIWIETNLDFIIQSCRDLIAFSQQRYQGFLYFWSNIWIKTILYFYIQPYRDLIVFSWYQWYQGFLYSLSLKLQFERHQRLVSLNIMGPQLKFPWNPSNITTVWYIEGFKGRHSIESPITPRRFSLSDSKCKSSQSSLSRENCRFWIVGNILRPKLY